jgi:hypothetical protein
MARTAVIEPDDDRRRRPPFLPSTPDREALLADLTGRRLEVREVDGLLVARISHGSPRLARLLAVLRGPLPGPGSRPATR